MTNQAVLTTEVFVFADVEIPCGTARTQIVVSQWPAQRSRQSGEPSSAALSTLRRRLIRETNGFLSARLPIPGRTLPDDRALS